MLDTLPMAQRSTSFEGRYRLRALLGQGRFASVFEAVDTEFGHTVALRVVRREQIDDPRSFAPRFFADGARRVRLTSRHTARVYDYGRTPDDTFFVAMELLRGRPLSLVLSGRGPLGDTMAAQVCERICHSLVEAHRLGLVHGQLSPGKVFLTGRGLDGVKVTGHGSLALHPEAPLARHAVAYAAPERLAGQTPNAQSDVYGVGLVLFELLTGRPAMAGDSPMRVALHQREGGPCRGAWYDHLCQESPTLAAIVQRCLARDPAERYQGVAEVRAALMHHLVLLAA